MSEDWGPWIDWSGGFNPAKGMKVGIEIRGEWYGPPLGDPLCDRSEVWYWYHDGGHDDITRYRILKPKGLQILEALLQNLPETVDA